MDMYKLAMLPLGDKSRTYLKHCCSSCEIELRMEFPCKTLAAFEHHILFANNLLINS